MLMSIPIVSRPVGGGDEEVLPFPPEIGERGAGVDVLQRTWCAKTHDFGRNLGVQQEWVVILTP
jgi:hypothetical protein